jgi:hypothetical protein
VDQEGPVDERLLQRRSGFCKAFMLEISMIGGELVDLPQMKNEMNTMPPMMSGARTDADRHGKKPPPQLRPKHSMTEPAE